MKTVPACILSYFIRLSNNSNGYSDLVEGLAVLVKSQDGDSYYLTDVMVEDKVLSENLAQEVYDEVTRMSYDDLFQLYELITSK